MAIDSDETGQKKLKELVKYLDDGSASYTEWERKFISGVRNAVYKWLTSPQKNMVGTIYDRRIK